MLLNIAWRNLWRNRMRSFTILAAVALGLWAGIFVLAFYNGIIEQRVSNAIKKEISHLQMHHPAFKADYQCSYVIPYANEIIEKLRSNHDVLAVSGRFLVRGMSASANGGAGATINGIVPEAEQTLTGLKNKLTEGDYFGSDEDEVLVGRKLAKKLRLSLHSKVILTFQDSSGNLVSSAFRVKGIFETSSAPYDESNVFVKASTLSQQAGMPGDFHEIAVLLQPGIDMVAMQKELSSAWPLLLVENWMQVSPEIGLTASVSDLMVYIFMGVILMALAFGIVNTMLMAILERTRELGMLRALGMNRKRLFLMILAETCMLVFAALPLGFALGLGSVAWAHVHGIELDSLSAVYRQYGYDSVVYPSLSMRQLIQILFLVLLTAFLSALYPARRALLLDPATAVKKAS